MLCPRCSLRKYLPYKFCLQFTSDRPQPCYPRNVGTQTTGESSCFQPLLAPCQSPADLWLTMADNQPEIWKAVAMADHFEKMQKLKDPVAGVPNFRRVPGYKVYCCGQPTVAGIEATLEKVTGSVYPKEGKIIWFNLRQEPSIYGENQNLTLSHFLNLDLI